MMLDIYKGWSRTQLKRRCQEHCLTIDRWQHIAMTVAEHGKAALPAPDRAVLERLIQAYRD